MEVAGYKRSSNVGARITKPHIRCDTPAELAARGTLHGSRFEELAPNRGLDESAPQAAPLGDQDATYPNNLIEDYIELRSGYAAIVHQLYALPNIVLRVPWVIQRQDATPQRRWIPIFPFYLAKVLMISHIRRHLTALDRCLSAEFIQEDNKESDTAESNTDRLQKELVRTEEFVASLPRVAMHKWLILAILVAILVGLANAAPLSQADRANVTMLVSSVPTGNIGNIVAVTSSTSFQDLVASLLIPFLALTLLLSLVISLFQVKRWLLNHPREELAQRFSVRQSRNEAAMRAGLYVLERRIFRTLRTTEPRELQLDSLIYLLYVCPLSLYIATQYVIGWSDPTHYMTELERRAGAGFWILRAGYDFNALSVLDFLLLLFFVGGLAYIAYRGLYMPRRYRLSALAISAGLIIAEIALTPKVYEIVWPDFPLEPGSSTILPIFLPFILIILAISALYCNTRCLLLRTYDTHIGTIRLDKQDTAPQSEVDLLSDDSDDRRGLGRHTAPP